MPKSHPVDVEMPSADVQRLSVAGLHRLNIKDLMGKKKVRSSLHTFGTIHGHNQVSDFSWMIRFCWLQFDVYYILIKTF